MSPEPSGISVVVGWLGKALGGPATLARVIAIATVSVAETLLELLKLNMASDARRVKESLIRRIEAQADGDAAEAAKKVAEAAEAANRANRRKRRDRLEDAERELKKSEAAKTQAEADAIRMDAETRRIEAVEAAKLNLLQAVSQLRQEGGDFFVDPENLRTLIDRNSSP